MIHQRKTFQSLWWEVQSCDGATWQLYKVQFDQTGKSSSLRILKSVSISSKIFKLRKISEFLMALCFGKKD